MNLRFYGVERVTSLDRSRVGGPEMCLTPGHCALDQWPRLAGAAGAAERIAEDTPRRGEIGMSAGELSFELSDARAHQCFPSGRLASRPSRGSGAHP